ncbi:MAG: FAD-binding protein, partial [Verrucomicrobiaceae bacterium]|nr:FAD-binding protein [Verrucomicrobiaceae bacterium]
MPKSIDELADCVTQPGIVIPHGNKTKSGLTNAVIETTATHIDLTELSGILQYEPDEFVFSALAGTPIAEISKALSEHGQFLPFDPPWASSGATLGGTVAAGLNGP